jgi:8-oxo-dGTP diphosphatase
MPTLKRKALAYITHGQRLLVFRHTNSPEVGIQAPAGTVNADESPDAAVMRKALEETGLTGLVLAARLDEQVRDMADSVRVFLGRSAGRCSAAGRRSSCAAA